jgi:hypothetical protein
VASCGEIERQDAIQYCERGCDSNARVGIVATRWTALGLFDEENGKIKINKRFERSKRESIDEHSARLSSFCRSLVLEQQNCLPLFGAVVGISADLVRGVSWLMAQNIYGLPVTHTGIQPIESEQVGAGKAIFTNDTRWNGIRHWMRFLGYATGEGRSFQIDPTDAVKAELSQIFGTRIEIPALEFLNSLAMVQPILDFGSYRREIEESLDSTSWMKPKQGHLSMSLSLALKRLTLDNVIRLEGRADAGSSFRLTGKNYRTWGGFETVKFVGRIS